MFNYVKKASYGLAKNLQEVRNESHRHRYCYYYGFQVVIGAINKIVILLILGLLFNCLIETVVVSLSFGILRVFAGGFHFKKYNTCAIFSILTLITLGYASKILVTNSNINLAVIITTLITFLVYAPVQNASNPIKKEKRKIFKLISIVNLLLLSIPLFLYNNTSVLLGIITATVIILPIFNKGEIQDVQM